MLKAHLQIHTAEKTFVPNVCQKSFGRKYVGWKLNDHINIHTRKKQFVCNVCQRAFAHRRNLYDLALFTY